MRIGIDIGGTFTDLCVVDNHGQCWTTKLLTTPADPSVGFVEILERALEREIGDDGASPSTTHASPARGRGRSPDIGCRGDRVRDPEDTGQSLREIVHATTVATNAILENQTARLGMITTAGFRDVLEIGRHFRRDLYNFFLEKPPVLVPRERRLEVRERIDANGRVVHPLEVDDVNRAINTLLEQNVEAIIVCLLHSYRAPTHELEIGRLIRKRSELPVILSHLVCPEYREYERFSTTAVHGAVMPLVQRYLDGIQRRLAAKQIDSPITVMQSSGGVAPANQIIHRPGDIVESGPAAGVIAAAAVAKRLGITDFITFDMGGTTTKASLVRNGQITLNHDYEVGGGIQGGFGTGYPLRTPVIDVVEIGTGGGSICLVDEAGHLHVGPRSAGAEPGPACYNRGGQLPTITDANAVLGRLRPDNFAGGQFALDLQAASTAIDRHVARPLGLSVTKAAEGIVKLANAQMGRALQLVSIERGYDPREFVLIAFGGAGPMHAAELTAELGCRSVVIPPEAGVQSAWGLLASDCRRDYSRAFLSRSDTVDLKKLAQLFAELEGQGLADLQNAGFAKNGSRGRLSIDARYVGQAYEVTVDLPGHPDFSRSMVNRINRAFHQAHQRLYGHSDPAAAVEWVTLRVSVTAKVARPATRRLARSKQSLAKRRYATQVMVWSNARRQSPVYHRNELGAGDRIPGPALIIQDETTIVVPPGHAGAVKISGDIELKL